MAINFNSLTYPSFISSVTASGFTPGLIYNQSLLQGSFKRSAKTNYTIFFNIRHPIPLNGEIILTFPSDCSLGYIKGIYWRSYTDTNDIVAQSWNTTQTTITITSLFSSAALSPNASGVLQIRIDSIQNPSTIMNTTSIKIQTANSQGNITDQVFVFLFL